MPHGLSPTPFMGVEMKQPIRTPQPGQVIIGYERFRYPAGCCNCNELKEEACIWIVVLFILGFVFFPFWFFMCVPLCMTSCRKEAQRPVYGHPRNALPGVVQNPYYQTAPLYYQPPPYPGSQPQYRPPPSYPLPQSQRYPYQQGQGQGQGYPPQFQGQGQGYPPQIQGQGYPPQQQVQQGYSQGQGYVPPRPNPAQEVVNEDTPVYQATVVAGNFQDEPQIIMSSSGQQQRQYGEFGGVEEPSAPSLPPSKQV
eukprot:TRINITY_DN7530_c1_g3_i1.p2 TRINITY_DN7530_c1_g3~~TRINITY_DN7530_c1_g3_i1.p2  ORF type:complete len:253 (-),score=28.17 TRINITY_DN7530_c1_g3_i1:488-1246(-)